MPTGSRAISKARTSPCGIAGSTGLRPPALPWTGWISLLRRRSLTDAHQILRPDPFLERGLDLCRAERNVAPRCLGRLVQCQIQFPAAGKAARDLSDARLAQGNLTKHQRFDTA